MMKDDGGSEEQKLRNKRGIALNGCVTNLLKDLNERSGWYTCTKPKCV